MCEDIDSIFLNVDRVLEVADVVISTTMLVLVPGFRFQTQSVLTLGIRLANSWSSSHIFETILSLQHRGVRLTS